MSSRAPAGWFGGVLLFLLLGGFAYIASSSPQGGAPADAVPAGIDAPAPDVTEEPVSDTSKDTTRPAALLLKKEGEVSTLVRTDSQGGESILFTDADEAFRIERFLAPTSAGWIGAHTREGERYQLRRVSLDGSGDSEVLREDIGSAPVGLRTDGAAIAFVRFSNAERSFGFSLVALDLATGAEEVIDTSPAGIALPQWSNQAKLAAVVGQASPDQGQVVTVWDDGVKREWWTTDPGQVVVSLGWLGEELLATVEPLASNGYEQARVVRLRADGQVHELVDQPGRESGLAGSGRWFGFVTLATATATSGPVAMVNIETSDRFELGTAAQVAGFTEGL